MSSSSAPHLGAVAGLDGVPAAPAVGSKADQLRQAERQALEERNREWKLRSLSTVREIEVLRMRRKQSIAVAGVDDASEVQELAKVQRKLNLERYSTSESCSVYTDSSDSRLKPYDLPRRELAPTSAKALIPWRSIFTHDQNRQTQQGCSIET